MVLDISDKKSSAFTQIQKEAIGIALSEVRYQLRKEIAALSARLAKLEERLDVDNTDVAA